MVAQDDIKTRSPPLPAAPHRALVSISKHEVTTRLIYALKCWGIIGRISLHSMLVPSGAAASPAVNWKRNREPRPTAGAFFLDYAALAVTKADQAAISARRLDSRSERK